MAYPMSSGAGSEAAQPDVPRSMASTIQSLPPKVHVRRLRRGFVEFDFALGDPLLSVEMIMPAAEFQEFCRRETAVVITAEQDALSLRSSGLLQPEFQISAQ